MATVATAAVAVVPSVNAPGGLSRDSLARAVAKEASLAFLEGWILVRAERSFRSGGLVKAVELALHGWFVPRQSLDVPGPAVAFGGGG